jgi:hypothetical protein
MKTARLPTRDRREDRFEREEKLGQALETLPGKTLRDRSGAARGKKARSASFSAGTAIHLDDFDPSRGRSDIRRARTEFSLHAPDAACVCVAGTFNEWSPSETPLIKGGDGVWNLVTYLEPGLYEYRFVVDGVWLDDPLAAEAVPNPFGSKNCLRRVA